MKSIFLDKRKNRRVKYLNRLKQRKYRETEKKFFIEGLRLVEEALHSTWLVEALICSVSFETALGYPHIRQMAESLQIPVWKVTDNIMQVIADTQTPQGIGALVHTQDVSIEDILPAGGKLDRSSLLLVIDGVQDPGNLGTIVRNADAAGADGIILLPGTVDLYNPKTLRASMGSIFHLAVIHVSIDVLKAKIKASDIQLLITDPRSKMPIWQLDLTRSVAFVLGNEAQGVSDGLRAMSDCLVSIPMPGEAESLNVATSTAILLYEAVRQRS